MRVRVGVGVRVRLGVGGLESFLLLLFYFCLFF